MTVLHAQCMQADALATGLTVLGRDAGWNLAEANDVAALFTLRRAEGPVMRASSAWKAHA